MKRTTLMIGAGLLSTGLMLTPAHAEPTSGNPAIQGEQAPPVGNQSGTAPKAEATQPGGAVGAPNAGDSARQGNAVVGDQDKATKEGRAESKDKANSAQEKSAGMKAKETDRHDAREGDEKRAGADNQNAAEDPKRDNKAAATETDRKARDSREKIAIDAAQRTKIQTYFKDHRPSGPRVNRDSLSVSIGIAVPSTIILAPLPPDVVVVAAACPIQYFVWDDDLVLVDSCTREVVDIIPNAA